jgi:hypothetical protein
MIPIFLLAMLMATLPGEEMLNRIAGRYSAAAGIQWSLQSDVHSSVFDETESTPMQFNFNPPDTFYFRSDQEEIIGIADTLWVLSKRHKQIQKRMTGAYVVPSELITNWSSRYELREYLEKRETISIELDGKPGVSPSHIRITAGKNFRIRKIFYRDSSGDDVTLTVKKERLSRSGNSNLFFNDVPEGYRLIDLTQ